MAHHAKARARFGRMQKAALAEIQRTSKTGLALLRQRRASLHFADGSGAGAAAVSYTHLTLPTIYSV